VNVQVPAWDLREGDVIGGQPVISVHRNPWTREVQVTTGAGQSQTMPGTDLVQIEIRVAPH